MSKSRRIGLVGGVVALVLAVGFLALPPAASLRQSASWQGLASPGQLSQAHAFLEHNCAACHSSNTDAVNCAVCHANNEFLLQRQPTAFHGEIGSCRECHPEHLGGKRPPTKMDHTALARIGLRQLAKRQPDGIDPPHSRLNPLETMLDCIACHGNHDRHFKLFGQDCAQCHATTQWAIPEFRHPSPRSKDCAECHQAPPSHFMGHFHMISMKVAGKPHADVRQCFLCHQTTGWNDIKGVGWYKHH